MRRLRCAIYTRKSTEEGLDQDFNSLDAQREACAAFIASQVGEGWQAISTRYDDGGFSSGNMERPALKRLLEDIEAGRIQIIVTYKVDRLSRSLSDFAKLVDVFDRHEVSFVSVTQQFNTTTSMGRLTLNVLLSFAQFEREVTAERIRDKIAASMKKGMWMGGLVPLGYDAVDRKLIVNATEAETVRTLFHLNLELSTVSKTMEAANEMGLRTKARGPNNRKRSGYMPFTSGHLHKLLQNPIYVGEIRHKGTIYPGLHEAIVDRETWDAVQDQFRRNSVRRRQVTNQTSRHLFKGRLFDPKGRPMSPTHAQKQGKRYRYYMSRQDKDAPVPSEDLWRIRAETIEATILRGLAEFLRDPARLMRTLDVDGLAVTDLQTMHEGAAVLAARLLSTDGGAELHRDIDWVERVGADTEALTIVIDRRALAERVLGDELDARVELEPPAAEVTIFTQIRRRGVEKKILLLSEVNASREPDPALVALVAQAYVWAEELNDGRARSVTGLASQHGINKGDVSRILPLAYLAPDIVKAIQDGRQPVELTVSRLKRLKYLPESWVEQRAILGFA